MGAVTLRAAIEVEIAWHDNEAKQHRAAADDRNREESADEIWEHYYAAKMHEDAAARLAVILYAHTPKPPEPEVAF